MSDEYVKFEDALTEDDYGLIIDGQSGELKGLWMPKGKEDEPIPDTIVDLCIHVFGIDPNDEEDEVTIH